MKLTHQKQNSDSERFRDWHKLVVAEAGFSMLDIYGRHKHGLDIETIRQFADEVNRKNETGSLHPLAPISAFPRWLFRDIEEAEIFNHINQFRSYLRQFIEANRTTIHASKVLIDLHVSPQPVPQEFITIVEDVFHRNVDGTGIEEVVIFS